MSPCSFFEITKNKSTLPQAAAAISPSAAAPAAATAAPDTRRRSLLLSGAAAATTAAAALLPSGLATPPAALAAYGDAARVFGSRSVDSSFIDYVGEGFKMSLPAKWSQPLRERPFPGTVAAFNDSGDTSNQIFVVAREASASSVAAIDPEELLKQLTPLFGEQSFSGETRSEGGFRPNSVAAASLMDVTTFEKEGKPYVRYDVLTRTADGEEGGRHNLLTAAVGEGAGGKKQLFIQLVVVGDKRWYKAGGAAAARGTAESFTVA